MKQNEKKDLLYVLGTGSKHNNIELRYSLRSIQKYCTNYDRIFVIGADPGFTNENVIYIPSEDLGCGYKHHNILANIQKVAFTTDISDYFILQSDDHFYVKPYDFANIPIYYKGELKTEYEGSNMYNASLLMTRIILEEHNYPTYNCSAHCGTLLNKQIIKDLNYTLIKEAHETYECVEPTCLINNVMIKDFNMQPVYRKDIKIKEFKGKGEIEDIIKDNFCFSIYDDAFDFGIEDILQEIYSEPSIYEKR